MWSSRIALQDKEEDWKKNVKWVMDGESCSMHTIFFYLSIFPSFSTWLHGCQLINHEAKLSLSVWLLVFSCVRISLVVLSNLSVCRKKLLLFIINDSILPDHLLLLDICARHCMIQIITIKIYINITCAPRVRGNKELENTAQAIWTHTINTN